MPAPVPTAYLRLRPDTYEMPVGAPEFHRKWSLPGVRCTRCGTWGLIGLDYPDIDLSGARCADRLGQPRAASLDEQHELQDCLRAHGVNRPLLPGTRFGPIVFDEPPNDDDFWIGLWTLMCSTATVDRCARFPDVRFTPTDGVGPQRFELVATPLLAADIPECELCGRPGKLDRTANPIRVLGDRLPPVLKLVQHPTLLFCRPEVAEALAVPADQEPTWFEFETTGNTDSDD